MNIVMTEYAPRAQCNGPGTFPTSITKIASCASILEIMETSKWPTVFGPRDDPATQYITPHVILTREAPRPLLVYEFAYGFTIDNYECGLAIESSDQTDSESWYKLWQETNAIFAHCLRRGQSGYSQSLGEQELSCDYSIPTKANFSCLRGARPDQDNHGQCRASRPSK